MERQNNLEMPRNIRYLPNDHMNYCIFRVKSVFLTAAQNLVSVRVQIISKLDEQLWNYDPKEKKIVTVSFSFVSLHYWFFENQHLDDMTCFCFISVSTYTYVTVCIYIHVSIWNLAAIYININLYVVSCSS